MERWHGNPYEKRQSENYNPYGTPEHNPDRHKGEQNMGVHPGGRNRRTVWTVTTQPYAGAHFATYPPALIEPCILAGSRAGDIVLDPFGGSGTTAAVAVKHHRQYVICELNPSYIELAEKRLQGVQPVLFGASS
jgi:DNA modification methylase